MSKARVLACFAVALALPSCSANYVTGNDAPVYLILGAVNGGAPMKSDVNPPSADTVTIDLANRAKNPATPLTTIVPMAITIERYDVTFYRSDGHNTQGVDVPYSISGNVTATLDVAASGTVPLTIEVVRAQAKLEPPLRNLTKSDSTASVGGNGLVITAFAQITVYGHTIAGQAVSATGTVQIDFADY